MTLWESAKWFIFHYLKIVSWYHLDNFNHSVNHWLCWQPKLWQSSSPGKVMIRVGWWCWPISDWIIIGKIIMKQVTITTINCQVCIKLLNKMFLIIKLIIGLLCVVCLSVISGLPGLAGSGTENILIININLIKVSGRDWPHTHHLRTDTGGRR